MVEQGDARLTLLRFGVVLSKKGGALKRMLPPFYVGLGAVMGNGQQPFSWVTLEDAIRAIDYIAHNDSLIGPVNVVAPECINHFQLAQSIGGALRRKVRLKFPEWLLRIVFGEMGEELLLSGQCVFPKRLTTVGFKFNSPEIKVAMTQLLS